LNLNNNKIKKNIEFKNVEQKDFQKDCLKTLSVAEFKEFKRRFKFKPRFKYGWFHLKLYQIFQELSRRLI